MAKPDPTPPELHPIAAPAIFQRWATDHCGPVDGKILCNSVEYATGWLHSTVVQGFRWEQSLSHFDARNALYGAAPEQIVDNAGAFVADGAIQWHKARGTAIKPTTPRRPRENGKVERANGVLSAIMNRERLVAPDEPFELRHRRAVTIYNRRKGESGYSPYFLLFGTDPPLESLSPLTELAEYVREPIMEEDARWQQDLARRYEHADARAAIAGVRDARNRVRAQLQERKALIRSYEKGDWVLRTREHKKHEPFYDGPYQVAEVNRHANTYRLATPGGIQLGLRYNGSQLFPAYVRDGHPVRSLWYASKRQLEQDRKRRLQAVGAHVEDKDLAQE